MLLVIFTDMRLMNKIKTTYMNQKSNVEFLFDESCTLYHADPGTEDPAQRELCFTAA